MIYLSLCLLILTGCMGGKTYPEIKLDPGNGGVKSISMDDAIANEHFGDFSSTPSLYYVGEGTTQDTLLSSEQEVSLESYKKWLKENHIVE